MKEITRIDTLSAGRISAVIGAIFGFVVGIAWALLGIVIAIVIDVGAWLVQIIGSTLVCALIAFVLGVIYAAIYNLVADRVGGIRIELDEV